MTTTAPTRPPDHATRLWGATVGLLIFLAGIALIGYVFATARTLFDAPPPLIPASAFATPTPVPSPLPSAMASAVVAATATTPAASPATAIISQNLSQFVEKLLLLLLMCVVGSVVASKGIDLFFKALAAPRPLATVPPPSSPALPPPD